MSNMLNLRRAIITTACFFIVVSSASAQSASEWDVRQPALTRVALEAMRARLDSAAQSVGYSAELRQEARMLSAQAQARLLEGDFQVGDRVVVSVEGQFTDTLDVRPNRVLALPAIGEVALLGVLRSELDATLKQQVARVIVDPVVHARPLITIAVVGQVVRPGYYALGIDERLTEALMHAGGPTGTANLDRLTVQRANDVLFTGDALQIAIIDGKTLSQLGIRAGDRIVVPAEQKRSLGEMFRLAIVALPSLAFLLTQL